MTRFTRISNLVKSPILSTTRLASPALFKKKQFSCATRPTRSWSAYPAPTYVCITNLRYLRHRLIFHQLEPVSAEPVSSVGSAPVVWFQRIQRNHHHVVLTHTAQMVLFEQGMWIPVEVVQMWWWSYRGMRVFTWDLTSSPEVGRWQEGLWHGLFILVFLFSLTSSLIRGILL